VSVLKKSPENQAIYKKLSRKLTFYHPVPIKKCGGYLVFYFICCIQTSFQESAFLKISWIKKSSQKRYFFFRYMMTTMEGQLYTFYQFPDSKNYWEGKFFSSNFWFQEMSLKREIFVNFLPQKFKIKYGWHCFKIFYKLCVSENFGMSPVIEECPVLWIPSPLEM